MTETLNLLDLCRCCLSEAGIKSLSAPYTHEGSKEIYAAMLLDVFDIILSPLIQSSHSICDSCVAALRNAAGFKRRVVACEARLREYWSQFNIKKEENDTFSSQAWCDSAMGSSGSVKEAGSGSEDEQPLARLVTEKQDHNDFKTSGDQIKPKHYFCDICCKEFAYKGSLEIHLKAHRGEKTLPCLMCETKYCSHKELNQHMTDKHYDGQRYICQICSENFTKPANLKNHINEHFRDRYKCKLCSKIFSRKKGLDSHLKSHSGEKKYACQVCQKTFGHNQTLKVHMYVHTGEKPHVCDECGNSFTQSNHLKRHIFRIHRGIKKYACNICQKKFSSKTYMLTHERLHKGDKPFTCQVCHKDFTLYTSLKVHLKLHTGVKPYTCTHCNRNFAQMASLRLHERSHTGEKPFSCLVCNKFFSDNGYLKIHMRVHTGERPFNCSTCQRSFREKGQLKKHMRTHTGEKYSCSTCNKQVGNLSKHMRVHVKSHSVKSDNYICKKEQW